MVTTQISRRLKIRQKVNRKSTDLYIYLHASQNVNVRVQTRTYLKCINKLRYQYLS